MTGSLKLIPLIAICGALVADAAEDADEGKKRYFINWSTFISMNYKYSKYQFRRQHKNASILIRGAQLSRPIKNCLWNREYHVHSKMYTSASEGSLEINNRVTAIITVVSTDNCFEAVIELLEFLVF